MTETILEHPAEPVENGKTYGGWADIARWLNERYPPRPDRKPISRQLAQKWFKHRETNGFPDPQLVEISGKWASLFDLQAVERWYVRRERERELVQTGDAPDGASDDVIDTIPLFQVDQRGHPIDVEQAAQREHPGVRETYRNSVLDL